MTIIASIDGPNRLIHLHADTVGATVHPIDIYKEMRTLRRSTESLRQYDRFLDASGNVSKGGGKFTERLVTCKFGTRIVPYDTSHELTINGTIITDSGGEGIACFDRTPLSGTTYVDINYVPPQVEIIEVATGGMTSGQATQLQFINDQLTSIENGWDLDELLRIMLAALAAKMSGPEPGQAGTVTIRDILDGKTRISMPVDADGYRTGPGVYDATP